MDQGEAKRRISAARILRDMTQEEMSRRGAELYGLDRQELGRTERGTLEFTNARKLVLCRVLSVPESWFDEPNVDELVGLSRARAQDALDQLRLLVDGLDQARGSSRQEPREAADEEDHPGEGTGGGPA